MIVFGANIPEIYLIVALEFIGAILFFLGWLIYNRGRFTAYLCEEYMDTIKIKKKKKPKLQDTVFTWKNFTYMIRFKYAVIDNKNKPILYYNYLQAEPIVPLTGMTVEKDSQTFKVVNDGKIMQHLGDRKMSRTYMYIIIGLIVAIGVVSIFSIYNMSETSKNIAMLNREMMNITRSLIQQNGGVVIGK